MARTVCIAFVFRGERRARGCRGGDMRSRSVLRLRCRLCLVRWETQDSVGLFLEAVEIDLHAIEHGAPVTHDSRHGDRLADILVRGAIGLGSGAVEIDAVLAWNLRGDREPHQLLGLAVELGFWTNISCTDVNSSH